MGGNDAGERTEQATPKRRREARKKGTVAKSNDLNNASVAVGLMLVLPVAISVMGAGFLQGLQASFGSISTEASMATIGQAFGKSLGPALPGLALLITTAMGIGLLSNFAQVGFALSPEAMNPSLSKLNPANGFKRILSLHGTVEVAKAIGKTALFGYLIWSSISSHWPQMANLSNLTPLGGLAATGDLMRSIALKVVIAWAALAAIDYFFQRKNTEKQLRMTKDEVKREMKEAEMSPELKAARAQRMRRLLKGRMMEAVKSADAVITNPTHFAVAIKYNSSEHHAPVVVAKGQDFLAAKIREAAEQARVPLIPNPPLARALYKQCEIGDFVPRELFQAVAEVLAYVYKTLRKVRE